MCYGELRFKGTIGFSSEEGRYKLRAHVSVNLLAWGMASILRRRHRRAYAPTSNTASHDNHEKINSWVSFSFLYGYEAQLRY